MHEQELPKVSSVSIKIHLMQGVHGSARMSCGKKSKLLKSLWAWFSSYPHIMQQFYLTLMLHYPPRHLLNGQSGTKLGPECSSHIAVFLRSQKQTQVGTGIGCLPTHLPVVYVTGHTTDMSPVMAVMHKTLHACHGDCVSMMRNNSAPRVGCAD